MIRLESVEPVWSVMMIAPSSTEAVTPTPGSALMRSRTSWTVTTVERSMVAELPERSVMLILPRLMPLPPLSSLRSVDSSIPPPPISKENCVAPMPELSRSTKPRLRARWVETRRSTWKR